MKPSEPILRPPGSLAPDAKTAGPYRYVVWLAFILALILALAVVFYLPSAMTPRSQAQLHTDPVSPVGDVRPGADGIDAEGRAAAEVTLHEYLTLYARLELDRAATWGGAAWSEAVQQAEQGDRLFARNGYADAQAAYARALDLLRSLEASRPQRLATALTKANQALESDQAALAMAQFELALAMEPHNATASAGLARAQVRPRVLEWMQTGLDAETRGEREVSRQAYARASQLDAAYQPAASALQRVTAGIIEERFQTLLSQALGDLDAGRFQESREALDEASRLQPDDPSVSDLRARLKAGQLRSALAALRQKAEARATVEDWQAAERLYEKALALQSDAAFALEGRRQARERLRLHAQLDHYLVDPDRLYADAPLANAQRLLAAALPAPADEPQLGDKLKRLHRYVVEARTPVVVNIRSDGQTEVTVYHLGRRGRFMQQQLELRPGTYTLLGSRNGYRDVRKVIAVKPGVPLPPVVIQCEERI